MITTDGSWIYAVLGMVLGVIAFAVGCLVGAGVLWWYLSGQRRGC
jgi:hypothetical protein